MILVYASFQPGIRSRCGAALIIALSVLAALLFLALPFVYSQSASVAGATAATWDGAARRGVDRATGLSVAMTAYATGLHRAPTLTAAIATYVQLPMQITDVAGPIGYPGYIDNSWRLVLDTKSAWSAPSGTSLDGLDRKDLVHGAIIEDEARRLDPNVLGERGWAIVLERAGIIDPMTVDWRWGDGDVSLPTSNPLRHGRWVELQYGRLANRLADWRPATGRYNRLEDLLGADPNETTGDPQPPFTLGCEWIHPMGRDRASGAQIWPLALGSTWPTARHAIELTRNPHGEGPDGYRVAPLTSAELERLRPLLSFLIPGQGRSGLVDVGTVVASAPDAGGWYGVTIDELSPASTGVGQSLRPHSSARLRSQRDPGGRDLNNRWAAPGDALALEVAPTLNVNTVPGASSIVKLFSDVAPTGTPPTIPGWPADPVMSPVESIGRLGQLSWLDPRAGDGATSFERPPLGLAGYGIVAIEAAATARDREGAPAVQRRRRVVVQAVPHERPLEAAWRTQGELEALLLSRHGSWIQAGPHPTRRIAKWGSDPGDMPALDVAGWLEPAPLVSFARSRAAVYDWRVPFGLGTPQSWDEVLHEVNTTTAPTDAPTVRPSGLSVGSLTAQGLRLSGSVLAYAAGPSAGPLRFAANGAQQELARRHLSLRFCLPTDPVGNVVLAEVRGDAADHSQWRIEYRHSEGRLVLVLLNAALPWTDAERAALGMTAWTTGTDSDPGADVDLRSGPGAGLFAPPDPATRVEFHYLVPRGLEAGRWYHLQAWCASDQPGQHGLALDGVVGRDATRPGVDLAQLGDHYTWPSLRLVAPIPAPVQPRLGGGAVLAHADIAVTYPRDRDLGDILPARGLIRVDDEWFSYTGISGTGGTGTISGVQRARRVNTNQASVRQIEVSPGPPAVMGNIPDDDLRWPAIQGHAAGALVTPGWARLDRASGSWRRGHGFTQHPFSRQPVRGTATTGTNQLPDTGGTVEVAPVVGSWPSNGLVRLYCTRAVGEPFTVVAGFTASSSTLTLAWGGPGAGARNAADNLVSIEATLISLDIVGDVTPALWGDTVQLLDATTGRCEWIRIDATVDRSTQPFGVGRFLVHDQGWDMATFATPHPIIQPRGNTRTAVRLDDWPAGTVVLPVQTSFTIDRLESGDVVTAVPVDIVPGSGPVRLVVRHAARDAYPSPASASTLTTGTRYDTVNERFALAHPVPPDLSDEPFTLLIGRGWSGDDLSQVGNQPTRRGALPRLALVGGAEAKVFLGSADPRSGGGQDVLIDDLCAGTLPGPDANGPAGSGLAQINGNPVGVIAATRDALPVTVLAGAPVFQQVNNQTYGLCAIGGEVFAYRRIDDRNAVLIARGLLGSAMQRHELPADGAAQVVTNTSPRTYREVRPSLPLVRLPLGPVGELVSDLAAAAHATPLDVVELPFADYYRDPPASGFEFDSQNVYAQRGNQHLDDSPFVLLHEPDGSRPAEVLRLLGHPTQANQVITARWLRGLYGTQAQDWSAPYQPALDRPANWVNQDVTPVVVTVRPQNPGQLNPVVIAWWPRFAPGLPDRLDPADLGPALRSRSFAWAGFPFRLHSMRCDPSIRVLRAVSGGICDVPLAADAGLVVEARALAAGDGAAELFDWENAAAAPLPLIGATAPFAWSRFQARELDGVELRVHWTATAAGGLAGLAAAADAQGRTPRLGATDAQAQVAPGPAAGIRLRCVAPTRVLAVEEAR